MIFSLDYQTYNNDKAFYLILDNVDINAPNEELPSLNLSSSNQLDSTNTNSLPSKAIFNNNRNVQPDILTHGNHTPNSKFNRSQENDLRSQSSIADKKSISSLYVDMIPDNFTHNNFNHHDTLNEEFTRDNENVASVPVFVAFLRVPINNVHSSLNNATWNKNSEIRLGIKYAIEQEH